MSGHCTVEVPAQPQAPASTAASQCGSPTFKRSNVFYFKLEGCSIQHKTPYNQHEPIQDVMMQ